MKTIQRTAWCLVASTVLCGAVGCQTRFGSGFAAPPAAPSERPPASPAPGTDPTWIDFSALRAEYGERRDFADRCEIGRPLSQFFELVGAEKWSELLSVSVQWLEQCPVDIDGRFVAWIALSQLGRVQESMEQRDWYRGLIESIRRSGDGRSPETAFRVISLDEEYALLRAMNLRPEALVSHSVDRLEFSDLEGRRTTEFNDGDGIDRLDASDREGRITTVHFNPEAPLRRLQQRFESEPADRSGAAVR